jgi:hypothetical protein
MYNSTTKELTKLVLLTWVLAIALPAWPEGRLVIPRSVQADGGYVSTQLLVKPCLDVNALNDTPDESALKDAAEARKALPPGTCDDPSLIEKLFKARFLQRASIVMVNDPWNLDAKIAAHNRAISQCENTRCLNRELDVVISTLSPVYLSAWPSWPKGKGLCATDPVEITIAKGLFPLDSDIRKKFTDSCGGKAMNAQICHGPHGKLLFVSCTMEGNQVNAPEWLYRVRNTKFKPLLAIDDGPFGVLEGFCNGMPDLVTSARINMGEYQKTYYRYDGEQYQSAYAYTVLYVGTDDNGNDMGIAESEPGGKVACR